MSENPELAQILEEVIEARKKLGSIIALMWFALGISVIGGIVLILASLI